MSGLKPHSGASIASADWTSTRGSPERTASGCGSAGGSPGSKRPVDEQAPDLLVGDLADEVLDVDAAVAQRAALAVGLGDLGGEGDDALEAGLDFAHGSLSLSGAQAAACAPDGMVSVLTSWTRSPSCRRPRSPRASGTAPSRPVRWSRPAVRRIEALDPQLGAFVELDAERALAEADTIAAGDPRPFAGVPIAVKANTPVAGLCMNLGSRFLSQHRPTHSAYLVRRLRDAGFVVLGTTNLPEFGILPTTEPRHTGPTRNPWDTDAHARRLLRRLGGGGRRGARPDRARQRRRRLAADPRRLLRPRRPEAEPRPDLARPRPRRLLPRRGRRADAHGDRDGAAARRAVRLRGRRRDVGPAARRAVHARDAPRPGAAPRSR